MNKEKYIGLILDERNDHYTIGYRETTDLEALKKWKEEMLECSNVEDCKILKVEEIEREKLDIGHNVVNKQTLYSEIETLIIKWNIDGTKTAGSLTRDIMKLIENKNENK